MLVKEHIHTYIHTYYSYSGRWEGCIVNPCNIQTLIETKTLYYNYIKVNPSLKTQFFELSILEFNNRVSECMSQREREFSILTNITYTNE